MIKTFIALIALVVVGLAFAPSASAGDAIPVSTIEYSVDANPGYCVASFTLTGNFVKLAGINIEIISAYRKNKSEDKTRIHSGHDGGIFGDDPNLVLEGNTLIINYGKHINPTGISDHYAPSSQMELVFRINAYTDSERILRTTWFDMPTNLADTDSIWQECVNELARLDEAQANQKSRERSLATIQSEIRDARNELVFLQSEIRAYQEAQSVLASAMNEANSLHASIISQRQSLATIQSQWFTSIETFWLQLAGQYDGLYVYIQQEAAKINESLENINNDRTKIRDAQAGIDTLIQEARENIVIKSGEIQSLVDEVN